MNYIVKKQKGISTPSKKDRNFAICRIVDLEDGITKAKLALWFDVAEERVRQILEQNWKAYIKDKRQKI